MQNSVRKDCLLQTRYVPDDRHYWWSERYIREDLQIIYMLILIKDNAKKRTFLRYICWRSAEMYQSYKLIFLMAQSVGTPTLLHYSARSKRATKHDLYLELL